MPAMEGIVPQLAPRSHLQQANALLSFSRAGLNVVGPTVAALMVAGVGSGWALAFDAATWLAAALLLTRVALPPRRRTEDASMLRELREGWSVFTGHTWLWVVVAGFGVMNAIHMGAWFTLGPALARETIGVRGWGLVLSAESVGLLLMTLVMLRVRLQRPLLAGMLGMSVFALPLFMLGLDPHVLPSWWRRSSRGRAWRCSAPAGASRCRSTSTSGCCRGRTPTTRSARSWPCPWGRSSTDRSATRSATGRCSWSAGSSTSPPCCSSCRRGPCATCDGWRRGRSSSAS